MSWYAFLKERESLNYGSDMYKSTVIRYLQTKGYHLESSSSQEGHLADLIMTQDNKPQLWVEIKATKVSIFEKKFKDEILSYFYEWLILKPDKRFIFCIFAHSFAKSVKSKEIFTRKAKKEMILEWYTDKEGLLISVDKLRILEEATEDEISDFFGSIDVYEVAGYILDRITRKREEKLKKAPNYQSTALLRETISRRKPIRRSSEVILNFMKMKFPTMIWETESKYKLKKTICEKLNEKGFERLPEFIIPRFEDQKPVIRTFDSNLDIFFPYTIGSPYQRPFRTLDHQRKVEFLYTHLRRWLWCKGLRRNRYDYYFPYENLDVEVGEKMNPPIKIMGPKGEKLVTKPRFLNETTFNFVEHRALEIRIGFIDESFGIFLWPKFLFTEDGITRIEGDHASNISKKYINPEYTRNSNVRSEINFWEHFLLQKEFIRKPDEWFNDFYLLPLQKETIRWSSQTVHKNQLSLELFMGEET